MALLIDTDLLIDLERGRPDAERALGEEERAISVITVSELLHGVMRATDATRAGRGAFVEHLLAGLRAIPITEPVARAHADIWSQTARRGETIGSHDRSQTARRGETIGSHDLWIAATAIAHGLGVATRNSAHFRRVPGLRVVSPES
ncbi:MAG TPA: PIN domain-containing protein [Solirubrobacteraceae bacterium]